MSKVSHPTVLVMNLPYLNSHSCLFSISVGLKGPFSNTVRDNRFGFCARFSRNRINVSFASTFCKYNLIDLIDGPNALEIAFNFSASPSSTMLNLFIICVRSRYSDISAISDIDNFLQ